MHFKLSHLWDSQVRSPGAGSQGDSYLNVKRQIIQRHSDSDKWGHGANFGDQTGT